MEILKIKISEEDIKLVSKFMGEEYPFEIDFNLLMSVVDKIESVHECSYKVTLQYAIGFIFDNSKHSSPCIVRGIGMTRIETAYDLVITFIKWYNTQTTTPSLPGDNNKK